MKRAAFSSGALYPRDSEDALRLVKKAGFDFAELMPQCRADTRPDFARRVRGLIHVASIHYPLVFFSVLYNIHPGMVAEARELNRDIVESAAIMGSEILVIHAGNPVSAADRAAGLEEPILDNLRDLGTRAAVAGITVALEHNPKTQAGIPAELLAYHARLGMASIKPMVDTTESFEAGIDPVEFIAAVRPCYMHLSDHRGSMKHIPAGSGDADWPGIARTLREQGYEGFWTLEPSWRYYLDDVDSGLAKARAFIEAL